MGFVDNINILASKLDIIESSNEIFDDGVMPILTEIAELDLYEAVHDLKKGNYLGNRKIDINLALNMPGIDQELLDNNPTAAESIWLDPSKTVLYNSATAIFTDGTEIAIPFIFDGNPTTISTHTDLLAQLSRLDYVTAIAQVNTIDTIVAVNYTTYIVIINGAQFTYTSDADATVSEIVNGLVAAINLGAEPITAANIGGASITLTANNAGVAFFAGVNANMAITITTKNRVAGPVETPFLAKLDNTLVSGFASPVVGEIIRAYDVIGQNSNLERLQLHVSSGAANDLNPIYFWAKTTSAFQTLSMRAGDIIKLGNDIDSIILLASSIQQVLEIQSRLPQLVDTFVNDVAQGDLTIYNKLTELDAIYQALSGIITVYNDIKVYGTNYINTVATNLNGEDTIGVVATDLNLGVDSKIKLVADDIVAVRNASANATIATEQAALATEKAETIVAIDGNQVTQTLASGSTATAYYNAGTGKFTFGIPQGVKGDKGNSFEVNAVGLLASRNLYDAQPMGFSFSAIDEGSIYFKLSNTPGDWSLGSPFGKGETGNGIDNIAFTSTTGTGQGEAGETDTYTITYDDLSVDTFVVTNGAIPTKIDLGLDQVDNTSDANKPVSVATAAAISAILPEQAGFAGKFLQTDGTTATWAVLPSTDEPVVTIATTVNEGSVTQGSYTSVEGSTVTISAVLGTISNHNEVAKTFDFTAHDVIDGNDDTDTISAYATKPGELQSPTDTVAMIISFVPITADETIQVVDFTSEASFNDGFDIL